MEYVYWEQKKNTNLIQCIYFLKYKVNQYRTCILCSLILIYCHVAFAENDEELVYKRNKIFAQDSWK